MEILILIFWLLIIIPFFLFALWTWWAFRKKKRKLSYVLLTILLIGLIYTSWKFEFYPYSSWYRERKATKELTGYSFSPKTVYIYESPRAFNGDGYSIWVYDLDSELMQKFLFPQENFFKEYPIKSSDRKKWNAKHWDKTPIKENENIFLDFALGEFMPDNEIEAKKLNEIFELIEKILHQNGNYYAYNYFMHEETIVGNIDFYIISLTEKKFIVINHNT